LIITATVRSFTRIEEHFNSPASLLGTNYDHLALLQQQGYSEGLRWFVPDYNVNRDDYIAFTKLVAAEHDEGTPLILSGESYGGCLTLHVAKYYQDNPAEKPKGFDSIILVAPAIIPPDLPPYPVTLTLIKLAAYYPTWIPFFMPNPVSADRIWRDEKVLAVFDGKRMKEMCIEGGGKPYRLATAVSLLNALGDVQEVIPELKVPFCVVHGEKDYAVPIIGTEFLLEKAKTPKDDRAVKRQPDAYHDLLADPVAEDTMEFMVSFAKKRVTAGKK
jgi:alpha-beta hydrolase superfamily lysophospholipase